MTSISLNLSIFVLVAPGVTMSAHLVSCFCVRQNQTGGAVSTKGVLGFCVLLLKTCEYDAASVFQKVLEIYRADLSVDEALFGVSLR